jgi:hypothetical protein
MFVDVRDVTSGFCARKRVRFARHMCAEMRIVEARKRT